MKLKLFLIFRINSEKELVRKLSCTFMLMKNALAKNCLRIVACYCLLLIVGAVADGATRCARLRAGDTVSCFSFRSLVLLVFFFLLWSLTAILIAVVAGCSCVLSHARLFDPQRHHCFPLPRRRWGALSTARSTAPARCPTTGCSYVLATASQF